MPLKTIVFDAADFLKTPEDVADYLEEAFADGDPAFIAAALGDASRALSALGVRLKTVAPA